LGKICTDGGSGPTVDVQHVTGTRKMRNTFSLAPTNNAKISAKRLQECYNNAYRDARLTPSYETRSSRK
jgi:hypothetical protein